MINTAHILAAGDGEDDPPLRTDTTGHDPCHPATTRTDRPATASLSVPARTAGNSAATGITAGENR